MSDVTTRTEGPGLGPDLKTRLARWETVTVFLLLCSILYGASTADVDAVDRCLVNQTRFFGS